MQARRLILTADDFGRSAVVNAAVEEWFRAGAITHASLMVHEPHAAAAVEMARRLPGLQVGLHLTLCDGLASDGVPLPRSPLWAGLRFAFFPGSRPWLKREIASQFARFTGEFGLPPSHWDGHCHLHLHPAIFPIALAIARTAGFRQVRLVREPGPPSLTAWILRKLSDHAVPALRESGIGCCDRTFGLRQTGRMDLTELSRAVPFTHRGVTEIYFHPGAERRLSNVESVATVLRAGGLG
jgi:predicted glycoside hydrolase/deacetylase ChbG (UPF0249 family)